MRSLSVLQILEQRVSKAVSCKVEHTHAQFTLGQRKAAGTATMVMAVVNR